MPEPTQISSAEEKKAFLRSYSEALVAISQYNQKQIENRLSHSSEKQSLVAVYNEIRYATRHLLDAVREDYADSPSYTLWSRAKRHSDRALYDIAEFEVSFLMKKIVKFTDMYKPYEWMLPQYINNYYKHLKNYHNYFRYLIDLHELDKESTAYKNQCADFVTQMHDFWRDIQNGKNKLFEAVATESQNAAKRKKFERMLFWFGLIISYFLTPIITELLHDIMQFFIS